MFQHVFESSKRSSYEVGQDPTPTSSSPSTHGSSHNAQESSTVFKSDNDVVYRLLSPTPSTERIEALKTDTDTKDVEAARPSDYVSKGLSGPYWPCSSSSFKLCTLLLAITSIVTIALITAIISSHSGSGVIILNLFSSVHLSPLWKHPAEKVKLGTCTEEPSLLLDNVPSRRDPRRRTGPALPKAFVASGRCLDLQGYVQTECSSGWQQFPPSQSAQLPVKNYTFSYPQESIATTYDTVTVSVRLGPKRAELWLTEFLPILAEGCPTVSQVLIDWWSDNPIPTRFNTLTNKESFTVPVSVLPGRRELGERYAVAYYTDSQYILNLDDDRMFTCSDLQVMVLAAFQFPKKIIGPSDLSRSINQCPSYGYIRYATDGPDNIVLNGAALIPTSLMKQYFRLIPEKLIQLENSIKTCQDIFIYYVAAATNPDAVMAVKLLNVKSMYHSDDKYQIKTSISQRSSTTSWYASRSACFNLISQVLPHLPIPRLAVLATVEVRSASDTDGDTGSEIEKKRRKPGAEH
eukprot:GHVQ01000180.1.p1 GENE.GHVQ01000180.1~~GHVQ01000180.1.p1  ORF type:complete len:520 (-),score=36.74 GHVQ01000180.1:480-2039(-)